MRSLSPGCSCVTVAVYEGVLMCVLRLDVCEPVRWSSSQTRLLQCV